MPQRALAARPLHSFNRLPLLLGIAVVMFTFVVTGVISYWNTRELNENVQSVTRTHEVLTNLAAILSLMKDAETGQRGFLITEKESYLQPYLLAGEQIPERLDIIEGMTRDDAEQRAYLPTLRAAVSAKLDELAETIEMARSGDAQRARQVVTEDRGRQFMDQVRDQIAAMEQIERASRGRRIQEMSAAFRSAAASAGVASLVGVSLAVVMGYVLNQSTLRRAQEEWQQAGQIRLAKAMEGDQTYEQLGANVIGLFAEYVGAPAAVFYVVEDARLRRAATYGVPAGAIPEALSTRDGVIGQAVRDQKSFFVRQLPDGYLKVGSALGDAAPQHLGVIPVVHEARAVAVMEFAFTSPPDDLVMQFFAKAAESIGPAVRSVAYRDGLQRLLEETQRQAEELQAQSEELRVSNEELEEQGRALRESQVRLENQQAELEQINSNLEEQTQLLEIERDQVSRSKREIERQAQDLESANQYKSEFLANMSHELRTPLNSSLILAKLLADNPGGNLTAEQVQFAETIRTAGNDLLTLINDILDLSKIEAGHMEVRPEEFPVAQLLEDIRRAFTPMAAQKNLQLTVESHADCPEIVNTDRQRLEQVLKNFLSNAIKFTERGQVRLTVRGQQEWLAFEVRDTGIGIPAQQQELIFEAFRQADSAVNRHYGGTGLGLSISRELAKLLGGEIQLVSQEGQGSTFTLRIPRNYQPPVQTVKPPDVSTAQPEKAVALKAASFSPTDFVRRAVDDRDSLPERGRTILVVEDDEAFSKILVDLAHEMKFQCLLASTAEDALATALAYLPDAVILDVGLPDHSGLWVLDRLKHERATRHIPVHVISAADHAEPALLLGAIGYKPKPIAREELAETLKRLESQFARRMRRVLLVEDDPVQLHALGKLLHSDDVETVGASTAAECLEQLRNGHFDCMVLDLTLPDDSGYNLLDTLSREESFSLPPVIVYTGRDLSAAEEQRLRKYSRSIIIKGAKSPERLLDEVTLFLHRVVSDLPPEQQRMLEKARNRDAAIEGRRILVVEDDVRNIFALTSMLEPRGAEVRIARNGREALDALEQYQSNPAEHIDLVLMDVMMPEMDGIEAVKEIRRRSAWRKLPVIMLTAKAMPDDQETCLAAGASDYMAKPLDVDKLLSLVRVWMPR